MSSAKVFKILAFYSIWACTATTEWLKLGKYCGYMHGYLNKYA